MLASSARRRSTPCSPTCRPRARLAGPVDLPPHPGELEVERALGRLAAKNRPAGAGPFFCGAGAYRHHVPASVDHIIQRSEFLTSYTPYQPEIAQGTLQVLFEFQTQVAALTGLPVANASMYDGSTACAEAVMMAARVTRRAQGGALRRPASALRRGLPGPWPTPPGVEDPAPRRRHRRRGRGDRRPSTPTPPAWSCRPRTCSARSPTSTAIAEAAHAAGALLIVVTTEAVSFGLLKSPGEMGADIAVAEGQSIGNALNFGGPYVGLFACREAAACARCPGRLCGETVDAEGRRGFVLTLSTREQHIRREKATSQHLHQLGPLRAGLHHPHDAAGRDRACAQLARINHAQARAAARARWPPIPGVEVLTPRFFNEFAVRLPKPAAARGRGAGGRRHPRRRAVRRLDPDAGLDDVLLVCATETTTDDDIAAFAAALTEELAR